MNEVVRTANFVYLAQRLGSPTSMEINPSPSESRRSKTTLFTRRSPVRQKCREYQQIAKHSCSTWPVCAVVTPKHQLLCQNHLVLLPRTWCIQCLAKVRLLSAGKFSGTKIATTSTYRSPDVRLLWRLDNWSKIRAVQINKLRCPKLARTAIVLSHQMFFYLWEPQHG